MSAAPHKCPTCGKTVYFAEKMDGLRGQWYHKLCFKCTEERCRATLKPGGFFEHQDKLYCEKCYHNKIKLQGYGFGGSGGTLSSFKNIDEKPESEVTEGH